MEVSRFCTDSLSFLARWTERAGGSVGSALVLPLPASLQERSNSDYPRDRNDGALWNGVGINWQAEAGLLANWRFLGAALLPKVIHQQNADFDFLRSTSPDRNSSVRIASSGMPCSSMVITNALFTCVRTGESSCSTARSSTAS